MTLSVPVIKSITTKAGTVVSGSTEVNELVLHGTSEANSTLNVFDGTTFLGTTTADSSGAWAFAPSALSNVAQSFTATATDATGTSASSAAMAVNVVPNITSFSGAADATTTVNGVAGDNLNANQPWSLTEPDSHTLRFEVRPGDHYHDETSDGGLAERSEIEMWRKLYQPDTQINVSYGFTLEPGAANNAPWTVVGQMHNLSSGPPPFSVAMYGENMTIIARGPNGAENDIYRDPNPIARGHQYQMDIQVMFGSDGNGTLKVWRDGVQIVNYSGPLGGGSGDGYYWKEGVYRASGGTNTMAADYSNLQVTTGPAPVPSASPKETLGGTPPATTPPATTPTTPTAPTVAPTVTQASASPGTGIEHAGDTITFTLGFSEAVTVSGKPTLSLSDGGTATYVGGSGTNSLTFKTTVASTDTNASALAITQVNLPSGASIKDAGGLAANLSGAVKTFSGLQIDPILPTVTQATASPGTGTALVGDTVTLTLAFNEAVTVTGKPTLALNDGNVATYVGGSGTGALTFKTTVASTDTTTSALAITGVNLPSGSSIKDSSGVAANLAAAVTTFSGLQIDPPPSTAPTTPPNVAPTVTEASASPGTGVEHVGDAITMTLGFSEAVTVSGTPTLSLNDGGKATYVSGSGTNSLTFKTTVASTDTNTSALAITGVNLSSGASIKDAGGLAANLSGVEKTFTGLQINPTSSTAPTNPTSPTSSVAKPDLTIEDNSLSVAGRGGHVDLGTKVTTADANDVVTVNITGLPKYETITDNLDGQTFSGKNITLTAAQVDSGLTLTSNYMGGAHPVATLTLMASAKDPTTGADSTSSPQTITVTDPRPATDPTQHHGGHHDRAGHGHGSALLSQIRDQITGGGVATSGQQSIGVTDSSSAAGTSTATQANQSFALLNQYLAGHTGRVDPGQMVAAVSQASGWAQDSLLTRPQH